MRTLTGSLRANALLLALALSIGGCGDSVLGPVVPRGDTGGSEPLTGPEILMISEDQSTRYAKLDLASLDEADPTASRALKVSASIDGAVGGRVRCGRFLLAVPSGAFDGEGTVTMSMPDSTVMVVDLEISPAELNDFKEPMKLCLLTDGTGLAEEELQIYWWDPDGLDWKALGCDRDLSDDMTVTGTTEGLLTDLSHFSRYSGGKAGW